MKLLLDTHILIWAMGEPARLGPALREQLEDPRHSLCFSVASLWELVIKAALGREGFRVQPSSILRRTLLDGGFVEIPIEAAHVLAADAMLARYPGPVRHHGSF